MALPQFQGGDTSFQLMQNAWGSLLNPIITKVNNIFGSGLEQEYVFNSNIATLLAANDVDSTSFATGAQGTRFGSFNSATAGGTTERWVKFSKPMKRDDLLSLELSQDAGTTWSNQSYITSQRQGTYVYGWYIYKTMEGDKVIVSFGNGGAQPSNAAYAGAGQAWSTFSADTNAFWRVRKISFS